MIKVNIPKSIRKIIGNREYSIDLLAQGLKMLWSVDISDCPYISLVENKPDEDIALCYRSLQHNYNGKYGGKVYKNFNTELLFDELGILPDWEKIKYYTLLDELF